MAGTPTAEARDRCVGCGAELDPRLATAQGSVERVGCRRCGLQLVRRRGESWEAIRG